MQNDNVKRLKADIASAGRPRSIVSSRMGAGEALPQMQSARRQLQTAKDNLQLEVNRIVSGVQTAYETARARELELQRALNAQQGETLGLSKRMIDYAALEREANSNRQLYENLLQRAKETGAASEYQGTNIQVIDKAEVPRSPGAAEHAARPARGRARRVSARARARVRLRVLRQPHQEPRTRSRRTSGCRSSAWCRRWRPYGQRGGAAAPERRARRRFRKSIRALRTAVLFSSADEGARSIVVTSTGPSEGKTVVSSNLAIALAQAGQRTLVIDADMRRPRMHEALGRPQEPGLSNVLVGDATLADAARATSVPNLSSCPPGTFRRTRPSCSARRSTRTAARS